ncbi:fimbria/pilus outer membrane usher protein [Citrobacter amalonaticus]|nr:fimbria/pilus outer membrane usher protein [Citrobacter amalonaticus]
MKIKLLALIICSNYFLCSGFAAAKMYEFDPALLGINPHSVDMKTINEGGQLPGDYKVDILLNGEHVDSRSITFSRDEHNLDNTELKPCIDAKLLSLYGVRVDKYPDLGTSGKCANLSAIPGLKYHFNFYNQELLLSIPQVSLRPKERGLAPRTLWDDGIPAFLLDYNANISRIENRGYGGQSINSDSSYVQLNPGFNLGAWRLRNQTNWQKQGGSEGKWQTVYSYAERGLYGLRSRLTLGDRSTPDDVFDSVPFRGVMLSSDEEMIPYNQRKYAPVIRGVARTQARVEVKQGGYTIYSQTVAPGPFALSDFNFSGGRGGGDLQVTVWETDGNPQIFTVPYQMPAIALHEGYLKYNTMMGQYRPAGYSSSVSIGQATLMYGLPWDLTIYGGLQTASHYQAMSLGMGVSMGDYGAVSVDGTGSHAQPKGDKTHNGSAWRLRYSKDIIATNTTFTMTSYRYASSGYYPLSDVLDSWENHVSENEWGERTSSGHRKSTTSLVLSQSLGDWGYLNLNGNRSDYWDLSGHNSSYGMSYGLGFRGMSFSVGVNNYHQSSGVDKKRTDTVTSVQVSVPFNSGSSHGSAVNATYQLTSGKDGRSHQVGLNGWAFDHQMNWDLQQSYKTGDAVTDSSSSAINMDWSGRYGRVGGNYSYTRHQQQIGGSVAGGLLVHSHGITLGQTLGETVALVEAPGAADVPVSGIPGVRTDFRGYTSRPYLSPYQENSISLDPTKLSPNVDLIQTDVKVVPTRGAVIPAKFSTRIGAHALMTLNRPGGETVPFGAVVKLLSGEDAGIVGDKGQVYLTGLPDEGSLMVRWGEGLECKAHFNLANDGHHAVVNGIRLLTASCQ